jgi:anti-anti-sigma factor
MSWSVTEHHDSPRAIRLDLAGDLRGAAVEPLRLKIVHTITDSQPDELSLNLNAVTGLDPSGAAALMAGYLTAIEHGTIYRVVGARGMVHRVLDATGTLEVLADSNDLASLLLAVLRSPPTGASPG